VVDDIGPASLTWLRYAIGALCLLPPVLFAGRVRIARRDLVPIALLGIVQFAVLIALLTIGLVTVPAARGAVLFSVLPFLAMLFGAALGQERLGLAKSAGVVLTIAGVAAALGDKLAGGGVTWFGEAMVLASAACGAACSVLYRPYLRRYPTLHVSWVAMLASVVALAAPAAAEGLFAAPPALTAAGWGAVVFIGVGSGAGYYLWLWALRHAGATRVTVFLSLSPITAALLGALLLDEAVSALVTAGLALVVAGLVLAHRPDRAPATAP